jgi:hypothetical protein
LIFIECSPSSEKREIIWIAEPGNGILHGSIALGFLIAAAGLTAVDTADLSIASGIDFKGQTEFPARSPAYY